MADMDVIKEVPGYKVILKAVVKSQIQQLVEQLAAHTDEESVILTASVADGTLSHIGSESGKSFLEDHEDVKSQFLGFCLKYHHNKKLEEKEREQQKQQQKIQQIISAASAAQFPNIQHSGGSPSGPRPRYMSPRHSSYGHGAGNRHEPYSVIRPIRNITVTGVKVGAGFGGMNNQPKIVAKTAVSTTSVDRPIKLEPGSVSVVCDANNSSAQSVSGDVMSSRLDADDSNSNSNSAGNIVIRPMSPSQAGSDDEEPGLDASVGASTEPFHRKSNLPNIVSGGGGSDSNPDLQGDDGDGGHDTKPPWASISARRTRGASSDTDPNVGVKLEPLTESEMELEITGVELGHPVPMMDTLTQDNWGVPGGPGTGLDPYSASGSPADVMTSQGTMYMFRKNNQADGRRKSVTDGIAAGEGVPADDGDNIKAEKINLDDVEIMVQKLQTDSLKFKYLINQFFTNSELITHSRTGKRTHKSGDVPRPPLDRVKFDLLQHAVLRFTSWDPRTFIKKFENHLKVVRRASKECFVVTM